MNIELVTVSVDGIPQWGEIYRSGDGTLTVYDPDTHERCGTIEEPAYSTTWTDYMVWEHGEKSVLVGWHCPRCKAENRESMTNVGQIICPTCRLRGQVWANTIKFDPPHISICVRNPNKRGGTH